MAPTRHANPFTFGDLALDDAFTDRGPELAELRSDMLNGQNVAIIAPRRYGKSSLLRRAAQGLVHEGVLVADVDLMKAPTKERLASKLARAIHDDIASPLFNDAVGVTGVALTKLDGSAKGGIAVAIAYELGLPVKLVGVGERLDDLRPFDPDDFARALVAP